MNPGILFVSPLAEDASSLSGMLGSLPLLLEHVETVEQARAALKDQNYGVILTEAGLADGAWLDILQLARQLSPSCEVIVTDKFADPRFWAEILNMGAYDMIAQPFYAPEVRRILSNACSRIQTKQPRAKTREVAAHAVV